MGLVGMINSVVADCDFDLWDVRQAVAEEVVAGDRAAIARAITGTRWNGLTFFGLKNQRVAR